MHFTYDGLGRCVRRMDTGTTTLFTYDEWNPIVEWDQSNNFKASNIYGAKADELLIRNDSVQGGLVYKQDKLGNVMFLLDKIGNVIERYTYEVFGTPYVTDWWGNPHYDANGRSASWYGNRFLFTGREYFSSIACYDYRNRMYRPSLGRFLQTDPIGFDAGDMNLFRYVGDDPVDRSDPTGLLAVDWTWSRLMWEQGNSQYGFNELYMAHVNAGNGDTTVTGPLPGSVQRPAEAGSLVGSGSMPVSGETLGQMYDASQENVRNTETKPDYGPGGKPIKQEFRTTRFRDGVNEQNASLKGSRMGPNRQPVVADLPKNPFGNKGQPVWDTHSHISGSGRPYGKDKTAAKNLGVPLGVQSATDGPKMYLYVPSLNREFYTLDGSSLFYVR